MPKLELNIHGTDDSAEAFRKAKDSVELLGQSIGVRLDRNLRTVLASFQSVQRVASLAFPVAAAIGFATYAIDIAESIKKAAFEMGGFTEALQKAAAAQVELNRQVYLSFTTVAQGKVFLSEINAEIEKLDAQKKELQKPIGGTDVVGAIVGNIIGAVAENKVVDQLVEKEDLRRKIMERITEERKRDNKLLEENAKQAAKAYDLQVKKAEELLKVLKQTAIESLKTQPKDLSFGTTLGISKLPEVLGGENFGFVPPDVQQQMIEFPKKITEHLKDLEDQINSIHESWHSFGASIGETISQAALFGRSWTDALKAIFLSFVQLLAQVYLFKGISQNFGSGVFGSFLTGLAGFGGGHAAGGPVNAGNVYMVGERGPELFVPNTSGMIVPNGAGGTVNNYYDFRGADPGSEARLKRMLEQSEKKTLSRSVSMNREMQLRGA